MVRREREMGVKPGTERVDKICALSSRPLLGLSAVYSPTRATCGIRSISGVDRSISGRSER